MMIIHAENDILTGRILYVLSHLSRNFRHLPCFETC